ncbi:MAG: glycosyltransferase [Dehalococcoidia bacterium]
MSQTCVSVIICVYTLDRLNDIHEAVGSVLAQTLKPHEVIASVDHNEELLHRLKAELPPEVKLVLNDGAPGLSETRNAGIRASTGAIVAFIDDDAVAEESWLEELTRHFRNPPVVGVGGSVRPRWLDGTRPGWFPEELDWVVGCTYKGLPVCGNVVRNMIGCSMSFRKEALELAGLFESEVGRVGKSRGVGEEAEMCLRIKRAIPEASIIYEPRSVVYHKVPPWRVSLKYLAQRSYNEGFYKNVVKRLAAKSSPQPLSVENAYLRYLLLSAIPRRLVRFYKPVMLAQAGAIMISIAATGLGYIWAMTGRRHSLWQVPLQ